MQRNVHRWYSWRLNRDLDLVVVGTGGAKVLVFPTRDGDSYEYERMGMTEALRDKIEAGHLQFYCVDYRAGETFYCWWAHPAGRVYRHWQYEEYILREVFPLMELLNPGPPIIAHGCSFGAYLAASIAFRHPERFVKLAAFSGRYDLTHAVEAFGNLLGSHYDEDVYFHTPTHFLPNLACEERLNHLRKMDIVLTIGREDPFWGNNEHLSSILRSKEIPHQLHLWDGRAHRARYWRQMARIYI